MADAHALKECPTPDFEVETNGFVLVNNYSLSSGQANTTTNTINMAEIHTFPKELPDWSNLEVLHRNTLPPRASFFLFDNSEDALTRDVARAKSYSLSGTWKFSLAKSPFDAPSNFFEEKFDVGSWGDIQVPGMWQLQGYGKGPQLVIDLV
jgi:beta-galactosidase